MRGTLIHETTLTALKKKKTLNILKASHWIILGNSSNDVDSTLQKRRRIDVESVSNFRRDDDAINVKKIALLSQSTSPTISTAISSTLYQRTSGGWC